MLEEFVNEVNELMSETLDQLESSMDREDAQELLETHTVSLLETVGKHLILTDRETEQTVDADLLTDLIFDSMDS